MIEVINIFREEGLVDEPLNPAALQENYVQNMWFAVHTVRPHMNDFKDILN